MDHRAARAHVRRRRTRRSRPRDPRPGSRQNWICTACGILCHAPGRVRLPERFVQDQAGHAYASTTAIYTGVSDEFRPAAAPRLVERYGELWEAAHDQEDGLRWHLRWLMAEREMFEPRSRPLLGERGIPVARAGFSAGHRHRSACRWTSSRALRHPRLRRAGSDRDRRGERAGPQERGAVELRRRGHGRPRSGDRDHAGSATARRAHSEATAIVAQLITDLDVQTAAAAVGDAAQTSDALNAMIEHLAKHPEALRSGRSDGPNSVIKLAPLCTAAGSPGWSCRDARSADGSSVTCAASTAPAASARAATSTADAGLHPMRRSPASCPARTTDQSATPATAAIPNATNSAPLRQATTRGHRDEHGRRAASAATAAEATMFDLRAGC